MNKSADEIADEEEARLMKHLNRSSRQSKGTAPDKSPAAAKHFGRVASPVVQRPPAKEVNLDELPAWKRRELEKEREKLARLEAEKLEKQRQIEAIKSGAGKAGDEKGAQGGREKRELSAAEQAAKVVAEAQAAAERREAEEAAAKNVSVSAAFGSTADDAAEMSRLSKHFERTGMNKRMNANLDEDEVEAARARDANFDVDAFRASLLAEVNELRANPKVYVKKILGMKKWFSGKEMCPPSRPGFAIMTKDGQKAVTEAIMFLSGQARKRAAFGALTPELNEACQQLCDLNGGSGATDVIDVDERFHSKGRVGESLDEFVIYGVVSPAEIVGVIVLSDGDVQRKMRDAMLAKGRTVIGIGAAAHKSEHRVTSIAISDAFEAGAARNSGATFQCLTAVCSGVQKFAPTAKINAIPPAERGRQGRLAAAKLVEQEARRSQARRANDSDADEERRAKEEAERKAREAEEAERKRAAEEALAKEREREAERKRLAEAEARTRSLAASGKSSLLADDDEDPETKEEERILRAMRRTTEDGEEPLSEEALRVRELLSKKETEEKRKEAERLAILREKRAAKEREEKAALEAERRAERKKQEAEEERRLQELRLRAEEREREQRERIDAARRKKKEEAERRRREEELREEEEWERRRQKFGVGRKGVHAASPSGAAKAAADADASAQLTAQEEALRKKEQELAEKMRQLEEEQKRLDEQRREQEARDEEERKRKAAELFASGGGGAAKTPAKSHTDAAKAADSPSPTKRRSYTNVAHRSNELTESDDKQAYVIRQSTDASVDNLTLSIQGAIVKFVEEFPDSSTANNHRWQLPHVFDAAQVTATLRGHELLVRLPKSAARIEQADDEKHVCSFETKADASSSRDSIDLSIRQTATQIIVTARPSRSDERCAVVFRKGALEFEAKRTEVQTEPDGSRVKVTKTVVETLKIPFVPLGFAHRGGSDGAYEVLVDKPKLEIKEDDYEEVNIPIEAS